MLSNISEKGPLRIHLLNNEPVGNAIYLPPECLQGSSKDSDQLKSWYTSAGIHNPLILDNVVKMKIKTAFYVHKNVFKLNCFINTNANVSCFSVHFDAVFDFFWH